MNQSPDEVSTSGTNRPVDLLVAFGHRVKLHHVGSKDNLNKDSQDHSNPSEHDKKKNISKLPRAFKTPNIPKGCAKSCGQFGCSDHAGDSLAGPSKPAYSPPRFKIEGSRLGTEKSKPSFIPRRRATLSNSGSKGSAIRVDHNKYYSNKSHIQRLNVVNLGPDFSREDPFTASSMASSRPIPTLGQIYRRNNIVLDGDRLYDWIMELDTPVNSIETQPRTEQARQSSDSAGTANSIVDVEIRKNRFGDRSRTVVDVNMYNTTNDNISDWLSNEVNCPKEDSKSGHFLLSPANHSPVNIAPKHSGCQAKRSKEMFCSKLSSTSEKAEDNELKTACGALSYIKMETSSDEKQSPISAHKTVVINRTLDSNQILSPPMDSKVDKALEPILMDISAQSKKLQYPSMTDPDSKREKQVIAPSYVECPSEILQKTTNFEVDGAIVGSDSPNTLSSIAGTDQEIRDDYSSQCTIEQLEDSLLEEHLTNATWCHNSPSQQSCMTFVKSEDSNPAPVMTSRRCICHGKSIDSIGLIKSDYDDERSRNDTQINQSSDSTAKWKKYTQFRPFPSYRYKLSGPHTSVRKRTSERRLCRHRWDHMWKKSAARWGIWSRSHSKIARCLMTRYFQSSIFWEDVNVQTLSLAYQETGTHTNVTEQKSAGMTTSKDLTSTDNKNTEIGSSSVAGKSFKSRFKHMNMGPSRFPFFNTKKKTRPLQTLEELTKPAQTYTSFPQQPKTVSKSSSQRALYPETTDTVTSPLNLRKPEIVNIDTVFHPETSDIVTSPLNLKPKTMDIDIVFHPETANIVTSPLNLKPETVDVDTVFHPKTADIVTSPFALHKPETVNTDTGTEDLIFPLNNLLKSSLIYPNSTIRIARVLASEIATQVVGAINSIETGIVTLAPFAQSYYVENIKDPIPYYKPAVGKKESFQLANKANLDRGGTNASLEQGRANATVEQCLINASLEQSRTNASLEQGRTNASLEQGRTNASLEQSRANASLEQGRTNASLEQGRTNASLDQRRTNASLEKGRTNATVEQCRTNASLEKGRTNATVEQCRTNASLEQGQTNATVEQCRTNASLEQGRTNSTVEQCRTNASVEQCRTNASLEQGQTNATVEQCRTNASLEQGRTNASLDQCQANASLKQGRTNSIVEQCRTNSSLEQGRTNASLEQCQTNVPLDPCLANVPLDPCRTNASLDQGPTNTPLVKHHRSKQTSTFRYSWAKRWSKKIRHALPTPSPGAKQSVQISTSKQIMIENTCMDKKANKAAIKPVPPQLVITGARILSISSDQLLPVPDCTSNSIAKRTGSKGGILSNPNCSPCFNKGEGIKGRTLSNPNCPCFSKCEGTQEEILSKPNCYPCFSTDEGTQGGTLSTPSCSLCTGEDKLYKVGKKKTSLTITLDPKKSNETQTNVLENCNEKDEVKNKPYSCTVVNAYTSMPIHMIKSTGQSAQQMSYSKSKEAYTTDMCVQYSHIFEESEKIPSCTSRTGHTKLISGCMLHESMRDNCTQAQPTCYDTETEAVLVQTMPRQTSISIMMPASQHKATATASKERYNSLICKWCARVDTETNTHPIKNIMHNKTFSTPNYESSVTSSDKATHNSSTDVHWKSSIPKTARSTNDRLDSPTRPSRFIGQTSSGDQTDVNQNITNSVLSSNLDAAKWIKRCTAQGKDYQSLSDMDYSTLKAITRASFSLKKSSRSTRSQTSSKINTISKSNLCYSMNKVASPSRSVTTQSYNSLSDLPVTTLPKPRNKCVPERESKQTVDKVTSGFVKKPTVESLAEPVPTLPKPRNECVPERESKQMVDKVTSDDTLIKYVESLLQNAQDIKKADLTLPVETIPKSLSKSVAARESKPTADKVTSDTLVKRLKETILQTCPDNKEAATCPKTSNVERQKSASVFTSKCVLPSPTPCCHNKNISNDCIFVYERPRCVVHKTHDDAFVQSSFIKNNDIVTKRLDAQVSREHAVEYPTREYPQREMRLFTHREVSNSVIGELLSPKAYKELYEKTKLAVEDQSVCPVRDTGMESISKEEKDALSTRSAGIVTSECGMSQSDLYCQPMITATSKQAEFVYAYNTPKPSADSNQTCNNWHARLLDIPTYDEDGKKKDYVDELVKSHLVGSCRYYSNLLTKHFGLVKEKVTKRLAPPDEQYLYLTTTSSKPLAFTEECTMKPSGRGELACQTYKARKSRSHVKQELPKPLSCCVLSPSLTNICEGHEKHHLKSVYYMLSAIEGRIRRLKRNVPG